MPDSEAIKAPIEIRFTMTQKDLLIAARVASKGIRTFSKWMISILMFLIGILFLLTGSYAGLFLILLGVLYPVWLYDLIMSVYVRRQFKKMTPFKDELVHRFFEDHFESTTAMGDGSTKWLYKIKASSLMLLLYINKVSYIPIPRRVCASDEEFETIAAWTASLVDKQ